MAEPARTRRAGDLVPKGATDAPRARRPRRVATPAAATGLRIESMPDLHEPFMVCAFEGWNDAAQSASGAVKYVVERASCPRFAGIDPEEFYVFTETRPTIRLIEGT